MANSAVGYKQFPNSQGTIDALGNCEIDFLPFPPGTYYTGSLTMTDSPSVAMWTVYLNGNSVDVTTGAATVSGVQVGPNDVLSVKTTDLQQFAGQIVHATFAAVVSPEDNTTLVAPGHDNLTQPISVASIQALYSKSSTTSQTFPINVPPCAGLLFSISTDGSNGVELTVDVTPATGSELQLVDFRKAPLDVQTTWFTLVPLLNPIQVSITNEAGSPSTALSIYTMQTLAEMIDLIPPNNTAFTTGLLTTGASYTSAPFPMNGDDCTINVRTAMTNWVVDLEYYVSVGVGWVTAANFNAPVIQTTNVINGDTRNCRVPVGSGRLLITNLGANSETATMGFTQ